VSAFHGPQHRGALRERRQVKREEAIERNARTLPARRSRKRLTLIEASHRINRRLADAAAAGVPVREAAAAWARGEGQP